MGLETRPFLGPKSQNCTFSALFPALRPKCFVHISAHGHRLRLPLTYSCSARHGHSNDTLCRAIREGDFWSVIPGSDISRCSTPRGVHVEVHQKISHGDGFPDISARRPNLENLRYAISRFRTRITTVPSASPYELIGRS